MARKSRKNIGTLEQPILNIAQYIRTAQYIRLSVEDSNKKGNSIENQKLILDDYVAHNPNMKVYDTYIDNGISGMTFNRASFQRMIDDIENGHIDCVIVKDLSRLGRNSIDTGYYIESYFAEKNIRFIAVTDNFDTENLDRNDGMMLHLKNIINEAYALDIGKKIKAQARQAMRDGQYVSSRPRYGYLKDPNDCHKLIINNEVAPVVKQIFELFIGGMSYNEICLQLNDKHIPTPSVYGYEKGYITSKGLVGAGLWQTRTIQQILSQEMYTGKLVQGKTESTSRKARKVDESQWIVVENTHDAIISQEVFDKAKERMALLKAKQSSKVIKAYTDNIWIGKVFCGDCGRALHRQRKKLKRSNDKYYLYCITNTRYERGGCDNTCISEEELIKAVIASIQVQAAALIGKKNMLFTSLSDKQEIERTQNEIKDLQSYISKNQNFLSSLYENLVGGIISPEEYQTMRDDYNSKISDAVKRIDEIKAAQSANDREYARYCDLTDGIADLMKNKKLTKALIEKLIDKIYLYKGRRIEIIYTFDDEFESEVCVNA